MPCMTYESPAEIRDREMAERSERERELTEPLIAKIDIQGRQIAELESMLCGVFTLLENGISVNSSDLFLEDILFQVNWKGTGMTQMWAEEWWAEHKAADKRRKEAEQILLGVKRRTALAKLTPEERKLLGV